MISHPPLPAHRAETSELRLKAIMVDGEWVAAAHILTRGPKGLRDRPATAAEEAAA